MLKLQFFGHLDWRTLENTLVLGKVEGKRRSRWQRKRWLESFTDSMNMNLSKLWETVEDRGAWRAAIHGVSKSWTRLRDCTRVTILWKPEEAKACSQHYSEHPVNWDHLCLMHIQSTCRGDPRWACGRYACHFLQLTALGRHPVPWRHLGKSGFYFVFARTGSSRNCPYKSISASF